MTTGLRRRPSFDKQEEVVQIIGTILPSTNRRPEGLPQVIFPPLKDHPQDVEQIDLSWNDRDKRSRKALLTVRKQRG